MFKWIDSPHPNGTDLINQIAEETKLPRQRICDLVTKAVNWEAQRALRSRFRTEVQSLVWLVPSVIYLTSAVWVARQPPAQATATVRAGTTIAAYTPLSKQDLQNKLDFVGCAKQIPELDEWAGRYSYAALAAGSVIKSPILSTERVDLQGLTIIELPVKGYGTGEGHSFPSRCTLWFVPKGGAVQALTQSLDQVLVLGEKRQGETAVLVLALNTREMSTVAANLERAQAWVSRFK